MTSFKFKHPFKERCEESYRVIMKYPERIPIICEKSNNANFLPELDKHKYLVPGDLTIGQFIHVIRKRMNLMSEEAIFLFVSNTIPTSSTIMSTLYKRHKDPDGFLYMQYNKENVFG